MIDLAPTNPYTLTLPAPVIVAPGCAAALPRELDPAIIGAIATPTATLHTFRGAGARWSSAPAGVVFERLPTVSLRSLIQAEARRWRRSAVPILLSLRGTLDELIEMAGLLEAVEGISGLVIEGMQSDDPEDAIGVALGALRAQTPLPLLPLLSHGPALPRLAQESVQAGADALVLCAYPRTAMIVKEAAIDGVLLGPTLLPWTLDALAQVKASVDVPLVALGGVADVVAARKCLAAGAAALLVDGALYGDPFAPVHLGVALQRSNASAAAQA